MDDKKDRKDRKDLPAAIIGGKLDTAYDLLRKKTFFRTFPEIGKIKIGKRVPYQKGEERKLIPVKIDRFVITKTLRGEDGNFIEDREMMEIIARHTGQDPEKLTRIPILFPFNHPKLNFQVWLTCYRNGQLFCRGDGNIALRYENGVVKEVSCPCERVEYDRRHPERCKLYGRLNCLLKYAKYFGGVWTFRTCSERSIKMIMTALESLFALFGGALAGRIFQLVLNREVVPVEGKMQNIYTVSILYDPDEDSIEGTIYQKIMEKVEKEKERIDLKHRLREEEEMIPFYTAGVLEEETKKAIIEEVADEFFPDEEVQEVANQVNRELHEVREEEIHRTGSTERTGVSVPEEVLEEEEEKEEPERPVSPVKKQTVSSPANQGQINIIRKEISRALSLREDDPVLRDVHLISYDQAVEVLKLIKVRKYEEAYGRLKDFIRGFSGGNESQRSEEVKGAEKMKETGKVTGAKELPVVTIAESEEEIFEEEIFEEEEDEIF